MVKIMIGRENIYTCYFLIALTIMFAGGASSSIP
jgi:hypothetical protein